MSLISLIGNRLIHLVPIFHFIPTLIQSSAALIIKEYNLGQKIGDKFTKLSKIGFSMKCVATDFLPRYVKFWLFGGGLGTPIKPKHFRDFLEIS